MPKKHTPGPWTLQECANGGKIVCRGSYRNQIMPTRDALLIAAAPEMLEALKAIVSLSDYSDNEEILALEMCKQAIAKAEGL